jgi:hypothetical protein
MDLTSVAEKVALAFRDNRLDWYTEAYGDLQALWVQAHEACNRDREAVVLYMINNFPHNAHELSEFLDFVNKVLSK